LVINLSRYCLDKTERTTLTNRKILVDSRKCRASPAWSRSLTLKGTNGVAAKPSWQGKRPNKISVVKSFVRLLQSVYTRQEQHLQIRLNALACFPPIGSILCWRDTPPWTLHARKES